ncbi:ImmA/IrrE family metallo-endopeptidase [Chloroflexota bacterium]
MTQGIANWTNPSVTNFIEDPDPIDFIKKKAREIAITAIQEGWKGPPFDPFQLAEFLKITVIPRDDINDARILPSGLQQFKIEFNPNKPRGRMRFSIAHEIAHSLFPDCAENTRNRSRTGLIRNDDWQLELLCNIAAAEMLMPIGTALDLYHEPMDIDNILRLQHTYEVSLEAISLRLIRITEDPCIVFAATRTYDHDTTVSYRIDYSIPSRTAKLNIPKGINIPENTLLSRCTAVGFTAKGNEYWDVNLPKLHIECVGIPPYPNETYPRIIGIIRLKQPEYTVFPHLEYLWGDALQPQSNDYQIIAHIVNDKTPNWGGLGFAREVRKRFPKVQDDFRNWVNSDRSNLELGNIHLSDISENLSIISMIAQHGYGPSKKPRIRYLSLDKCLEKLVQITKQKNASVHMPRIGSGQAGGNWKVIAEMIDETLVRNGTNVDIYSPPSHRLSETQSILDISTLNFQ